MLHRIHECLPGAGVLVVDDGSPDGTADLVKGVAAELPDVHLLARAVEVRARQRVPGRLRLGSRARLRRLHRDRRRLLARPRRAADVGGAARRGLRRRHRLALRRGGLHPELGLAPPSAVARWQRVRVGGARSRGGRLDGGVPGVLGRDLAPARPRPDPGRGLRLPDRDDLPGDPARRHRHRGADQLRRPRRRRVEDVLVHRGRGARPGDVVGPGTDRARGAPCVDGRAAGQGSVGRGRRGHRRRRGSGRPDADRRAPKTRFDRHESGTGAA